MYSLCCRSMTGLDNALTARPTVIRLDSALYHHKMSVPIYGKDRAIFDHLTNAKAMINDLHDCRRPFQYQESVEVLLKQLQTDFDVMKSARKHMQDLLAPKSNKTVKTM